MAKYRVKVVRTCYLKESAFIDVEAESSLLAEEKALKLTKGDNDSLIKFDNKGLDSTDYEATCIRRIVED